MGGIAVVVCDLDGVVRHFDADALSRIERAHGLAQGTIARVALSPGRLAPAVCGAISDEAWRAGVADELAASIGSRRAREAVAAWSEDVGTADATVLALLAVVRRSCPVVLLTNATSRLRRDLGSLGLLAEVDAVVSSAETGSPKPQPDAFIAADAVTRRLLGHRPDPSEILFVDDDADNVRAAARHGWTAVRFVGTDALERQLRAVGLLDRRARQRCCSQLPSGKPPRCSTTG